MTNHNRASSTQEIRILVDRQLDTLGDKHQRRGHPQLILNASTALICHFEAAREDFVTFPTLTMATKFGDFSKGPKGRFNEMRLLALIQWLRYLWHEINVWLGRRR
jgi:hypothetical protein